MRLSLALPLTTGLFLLAVLAHLGFFDLERLARGMRNLLVGLGPLAGTLGIAAYTVGYLAKIYADLFEGTDPEIMEAVRSTGASKLQLVRFVILPEAANAVLAQVLFMLEYNIRASSVLGFVGAGGLGFVIQIYLQSLDYQRLATILLLVLVIVLVMDGVSAWLRKHFLLSAQAS